MFPIENVRGDQCITFHVHIQLFLFFHLNLCGLMCCIVCSWSHEALMNGYHGRNKNLRILGIDMRFLTKEKNFQKNIKTTQSCKEFNAESETTFGFSISATVGEKSHRRHLRPLTAARVLEQCPSKTHHH